MSDSVLRYLPTNLTAPETADELHVSRNTVKAHMRHLYAKLDARRRADAVARARALGFLAPSPPRARPRFLADGERLPGATWQTGGRLEPNAGS